MKYYCLRCGFKASQRSNLENHLNRKNICDPIDDFISIDEVKKHYGFDINKNKLFLEQITTGEQQVITGEQQVITGKQQVKEDLNMIKTTGKQQLLTGKRSSDSRQTAGFSRLTKIECEFCGKSFTRKYGLKCHLKVCNLKKENENDKKNLELENQILIEKINKLEGLVNNISSNNTTNNNTNNTNNNHSNNVGSYNTDNSIHNTININNYGCENKDYITKDYLIKLLKEPFQAIPKLIEYTHFNKDHPENQNIKLPNKKQPYVKVLKDDKWIYADRKSTILDLIDEKHCQLNDTPLLKHVEDKFSDNLQNRFERFNERYLNDEKEFTSQLYKETELVMINNS